MSHSAYRSLDATKGKLSHVKTRNDTVPYGVMLVAFSSLVEFCNVIILFSCAVLRCGDKWKKENSSYLLFMPSNSDLVPGQDMTQCRITL